MKLIMKSLFIIKKKIFYVLFLKFLLMSSLAFGQFNDNTPGTKTWTAPAGVTSVIIEVWGGGGGGRTASASPYAGGGGSGGGYVRAVYTVVPGNSYTYRVGSGGTAGNNGQSSYFINATTINAVGGVGATSTAGAIAPTSGNVGGTLVSTYGGNGGTAPSSLISGGGGSSAGFTNGNNAVGRYGGYAPIYGYDGANGVDAHNNGINGRIGAGGSGGARNGGFSSRSGGAGGSGQIRISFCASGAPSFTGGISTRDDLYISKFQFVGMLNDNLYVPVNSTYVASGYQNHTVVTEIAKQPQGSVMNVEAYATAPNSSNFGRWRAWVDWNKDGDFFDIGEEVYSMVNYTTPSVTFGFAISSTQAVGTYKLRISNVKVSGYDEYFGPCQVSANLGEVEDHIFEVVSDCSAKVLSVNTVNEFDGERCGPGSVRLSAKGTASAVSFNWYDYDKNTKIYTYLGTGITYNTSSISSTKTYYVKAITNTDSSAANYCETPFFYPVEARIDPNPTVTFSTSDPAICGEDKPSILISASGDKYQDVIFEKFDSGLGVFGDQATINTFYDNYGNNISGWKNSMTSQVIPLDPPYEGLSPALSSGYFGGNFAMINSDLERPKIPDTAPYSISNYLVSSDLNINGFNTLLLEFDIYHFSIANNINEGYFEVEYFDGSIWKSLKLLPDNTVVPNIPDLSVQPFRYYINVGNPLKWYHFSVPIPGNNFTATNFKLRFTHFSYASASNNFKEAITTIDNVKLSGLKNINTPFAWNSASTTIYDSDCTTVLSGTDLRSTICVKPTASELESVNWTLNANANFSNGCPAIGSFVVDNDTKTWRQPGITDWNQGAQWRPSSVPTINKCVIVRTPVELPTNTNGSHGLARSVIVKSGGKLTINPKSSLTIQNYLKNEAAASDVLVESDANLLQINNSSVNIGNITVKRDANLKRLDYNYWGTPVTGQNVRNFSTNTLTNRFYVYREKDDFFDGVFSYSSYSGFTIADAFPLQSAATYTFELGKGYAIRAPNDFTNTVTNFSGAFLGVPNNGVVNIPIVCSSCSVLPPAKGNNLISNPYPSNIDFEQVYTLNSGLIYNTYFVWTNTNYNPKMQGENYPGTGIINNYALYNAIGGLTAPYGFTGLGTNTPVTPASPPNRYIKVGQGFIVKAKGNGTLTLNNSMRSTDNTAIFFNRMGSNEQLIDRFWLSLKTPLDFVSPILIGYKKGASNRYEMDYDAEHVVIGSDSFYSLLDDKKLAIQGRYPFQIEDSIPLGTNYYESGIHTISLDRAEGVFANGQNIYLKDNYTGVVTNLSQSPYRFTADAGEVKNRFEILYTNRTLGSSQVNQKEPFVIYKEDNAFVINANEVITLVKLFDVTGKLVNEQKVGYKSTKIFFTEDLKGVFLLEIITPTKRYTHKVIN